MAELMQHLLVSLAFVIIPISLFMWLLAIDRLRRGLPLLEWMDRRPVPWSMIDLLLIGLLGFAVLAASQWICLQWFELPAGGWELHDLKADQQVGVLLTFSASSLMTLLASIGVCRWRLRTTAADLGIVPAMWRRDLALGFGAFVMLVLPVLVIHFVAQQMFPSEEGHPFIDLVMDPRFEYLLPIALAALVAAPLVEEFFFRVMLQGWLERIGTGVGLADVNEPDVGCRADDGTETAAEYLPVSDAARLEADVVADDAPSRRPATPAPMPPGSWRIAAILVSSLAFAMAHFGQGPAPISLFFLALGLGYLYQRTHRILPCIVVHFLVNLTAVLQLFLAIADQQG